MTDHQEAESLVERLDAICGKQRSTYVLLSRPFVDEIKAVLKAGEGTGASQSQPLDAEVEPLSANAEPSGAFTPGPWMVHDVREVLDEIWIEAMHPEVGEVSHASVRYGCDEARELGDIEANAHLIAAAPDLLAALEACLDFIGDEYTDARAAALEGDPIEAGARPVWHRGWQAIAKALTTSTHPRIEGKRS